MSFAHTSFDLTIYFFTVFKGIWNFFSAIILQTFYFTWPIFRQCLILKHLGNTCCHTKITVNLEWRMCVKQIRIRAAAIMKINNRADICELLLNKSQCIFTISEPCPKADLPAEWPACAAEATNFKRFLSSFIKLLALNKSGWINAISFL